MTKSVSAYIMVFNGNLRRVAVAEVNFAFTIGKEIAAAAVDSKLRPEFGLFPTLQLCLA